MSSTRATAPTTTQPIPDDALDFVRRWAASGAVPAVDRSEALERVVQALERDRARHLLAPASDEDLARLASAVQQPLPAQYRLLLRRLGGGILYDSHELFGARRLMVHDIELVPDALAMRGRRDRHPAFDGSPFFLPLHREGRMVRWIDLRDGSVRDALGRSRHRDLAAFLVDVVLPARRPD